MEIGSGSEWLSVAKDTRAEPGLTTLEHRFAITANTLPQERTATIVFKDLVSDLQDEITVVQAAWIDPHPERTALEAIYRDAHGAGWTRSDNWCSDCPLGEWYGVSTDAEGHITELRLPHNNLRGDLAHEIANLTHLRILDLSYNELDGDLVYELPISSGAAFKSDLDDLTALEEINLSHNQLVATSGGALALENMPFLRKVDLSYNRLCCWLSSKFWKPLFENGRVVDLIFNGNQMYGDVDSFIENHPEWGRLALQLVRQYYPHIISWTKDIHVPDFTFTDMRNGDRQSIRTVCSANKLTMLLAWDPTNEDSNRFAERSVRRYHTLYGAQGFAVVAIIPEGEEYRQAAERYLAVHEVAWPVVADYADAQGRRIVLPTEPYPSYLLFDSEGVLKEDIHSEAWYPGTLEPEDSRTFDLIGHEFQYDDYMNRLCYDQFGECTYESKDYSMNKRTEQLQQATKGKGIDLVLIGDFFTDIDIETEYYRDAMEFVMESYFSVEPMKTYREYFNVYMVYAVSKKRQIGSISNSALSTMFSSSSTTGLHSSTYVVDKYMETIQTSTPKFPVIVVNGDMKDTGRVTFFPNSTPTFGYPYAGIMYGNRKWAKILIHHEGVGHGFGLLADEYILSDAKYHREIPESEKNKLLSKQKAGVFLNVSLTYDPEAVLWAHLIGNPRYPEIGIFRGGYCYSEGVWRSVADGIMNTTGYDFGAFDRELLVRRILTLAGEEYTFETFLENDVLPTKTTLNTYPMLSNIELKHCPPVFLDEN
ncbi:M64 family metallopeptidase [uncultured Parabacteroides sp.]|uniref:M64 family metallopeptidase n=1 Tax=uncultured Parabacteroides sp. TaxID=512312 RepID=UPI00267543F5|nr:M64 family metallopeptidase [uncultured Parabacteroides sp.]